MPRVHPSPQLLKPRATSSSRFYRGANADTFVDAQYQLFLEANEIADDDPGIVVGQQAAAQLLAVRVNDGSHPPKREAVHGWHGAHERFSDVAQDIEDARIYEGIHFRFADAVGRRQGSRSANWAFSHFLRPLE